MSAWEDSVFTSFSLFLSLLLTDYIYSSTSCLGPKLVPPRAGALLGSTARAAHLLLALLLLLTAVVLEKGC